MSYEFTPTLPDAVMTADVLIEAADIIDVAHDILLHTGVSCGEKGKMFDPSAERNCTWEAVAIAMGVYMEDVALGKVPDWGKLDEAARTEHWRLVREEGEGIATSLGVLGSVLPSPGTNDCMTEDEVFDAFRQASKLCREVAADAAPVS